jgi:hypothetical protein
MPTGYKSLGEDVDKRIQKKFIGLIWMKNPNDYRGMLYKQMFIDNTYGEECSFLVKPCDLLYGNSKGAAAYSTKRRSHPYIYTREVIISAIASCKDLSDFRENHKGCYVQALREPDFEDLISGLYRKGGAFNRSVYRITDDVSVYYGISHDPKQRERQYRRSSRGNRNNREAQKILKNGGRFEVLTGILPTREAREKEKELIATPEESLILGRPLLCINIRKGGEAGGNAIKWAKEQVLAEAVLYKSRFAFQLGSSSAYQTAHNRGWLEEACSHMGRSRRPWTLEEARQCAQQCATRSEFQNRFKGAYMWALRQSKLDDVCSNMKKR